MNGGIAPRILILETRWRRVVSSTPLPLYLEERTPPVPIGPEAVWAPEPIWTRWRGKNQYVSKFVNFFQYFRTGLPEHALIFTFVNVTRNKVL
jgi:hypothetical protein